MNRSNDEMYIESQEQRALERKVRESKRTCAAYDTAMKNAGTDEDRSYYRQRFNRTAVTLKKREAALREFAEKTGRRIETDRTMVGGFGRRQSAKAVYAAKHPTFQINLQLFGRPDYTKQSVASIEKGISSLHSRISEHNAKINVPSLFVPSWDALDPRRQQGLIKHWQKEVKNFETQILDMTEELSRRNI